MADNFGSQIVSELGQIAKDVGKSAAQLPKDIAGKALESLGGSSGKKQASAQTPQTAFEKMAVEPDKAIKRQLARKALEELAGGKIRKPREPSIWERLQQEQEQKKQILAQQKTQQSAQSIPMPTSKRKRGDLYGTQAKKTATENRTIRQD